MSISSSKSACELGAYMWCSMSVRQVWQVKTQVTENKWVELKDLVLRVV